MLGFRAEERQRLRLWDLWGQVMETHLNTAFVVKGSSLVGETEKFTGSPDSGGISHNVCRAGSFSQALLSSGSALCLGKVFPIEAKCPPGIPGFHPSSSVTETRGNRTTALTEVLDQLVPRLTWPGESRVYL